MDKLIHTALNSMHSAKIRQNVSSQNLSNAQVAGYRGDEISGRFGSLYLQSDRQHESRVFNKQSEPGLFSTKPGELRETSQPTDIAIVGDGYFLTENANGKLGFSRRGDMSVGVDGILVDGSGVNVLDTSLNPINVPPFRKIFVSEDGKIYIQPVGAEPGTRQQINQIALTSSEGLDLVKGSDGVIQPKGGFVREEFNPDQSARVKQGFLESSNVSVFNELVNNVEIQKHYQLNVKLISLAKKLDEAGASLMELPGG